MNKTQQLKNEQTNTFKSLSVCLSGLELDSDFSLYK